MRGHKHIVWFTLLVLTGCVTRTLTLTSNPPGALVYLNGQEVGTTPLTHDFTWYGNYDVEVRKEGYQTLRTETKVKPPVWQWIGIDLLADLMPLRLEDHQQFAYALRPAATRPANAEFIVGRGQRLATQLQSSKHTRQPTTQPHTPPQAEQTPSDTGTD